MKTFKIILGAIVLIAEICCIFTMFWNLANGHTLEAIFCLLLLIAFFILNKR